MKIANLLDILNFYAFRQPEIIKFNRHYQKR